jgi:Autotransporter beta-domain
MKFSAKLCRILITLIATIAGSLSMNAQASCTITGGVISADCSGTTTWTSGNITVNNGVTVSGPIYNPNSVGTLTNNGTMAGGSDAIYNNGGTITSIINNNVMGATTAFTDAIYNVGGGVITTLTNNGTLLGGNPYYGAIYNVANDGVIGTFNNLQGRGNASGAVDYHGDLPTNYNIIIRSLTQYGQLATTSTITGLTTFGIYAGGISGVAASTVTAGTYTAVLSGVSASSLNNTTGTYGGYNWTLNLESGSTTIWDLLFVKLGPSTADTQASLANTASSLQNIYTLQNSVLANSFSYDCTVFGANNVCVSAGGRNTAVSAANGLNNTSGLLIAAYRPHANYRIGAYADQNLSVNNAGSTVNLGNNTPLIGVFGAWNERFDGAGTEVKVSAAYGQKNTTINRQVVGTSEAGSGSSQLNSQGAQVVAKYGFGLTDNVIVSPYAGMRYTQNNMGGYTEGTSSTVTAPLTYSALNTNATTALAGVGTSYRGIPQTNLFASAGIETDTNTANGSYSATGVSGLTPVNFNPNPVKTRATAMLGASYDIEKNQRLGITGIYRQEAYQATATTTVMATYTVGL